MDSITRAFNTLKVAATDSLDASHLNTFDLVAETFSSNLACYNDGADPSHYVRIEEPWITYNNIDIGIEGDEPGEIFVVENCTVFGNGQTGVDGELSAATTTIRNTISMNNVGSDGELERITTNVIPGLGSSPAGARYRYRDDGLTNDMTYYYQLEDIDTSGATEMHGPVSAVPRAGAPPVASDEDASGGTDWSARSLVTFGDPSANRFEVLSWDETGAVVELRTEGFFAEPAEDGSVIITAPGLEPLGGGDVLAISVARPWINAVAGVGVKVVGIETSGVEIFSSLRPLDPERFDLVATSDGVVRVERRRRSRRRRGLTPRRAARIRGTEFQGEMKQAQLEIAPLRWNARRSELRLTRRLTVCLAFTGRAKDEFAGRGRYRPRRFQDVIARFATTSSGLHVVHYHQIFGASRRAYDIDALRLSRLGQSVPFHVEPDPSRMDPRSKLYFLSAGPDANPYGHEAVYELEWSDSGATMTNSERESFR